MFLHTTQDLKVWPWAISSNKRKLDHASVFCRQCNSWISSRVFDGPASPSLLCVSDCAERKDAQTTEEASKDYSGNIYH